MSNLFELPAYMHNQLLGAVDAEYTAAVRKSRWAVVLGLIPTRDGDQWCILYGENLQEGICAFGKTPDEAIANFDNEMSKPIQIAREAEEKK